MKIFLVLLAVAYVLAREPTQEDLDYFQRIHDECQADPATRVDEAVITKIKKQGIWEESKALDDHLFCYSKKAGLQDEAGILKKDVIKEKLLQFKNPAEVEKIMEECVVQKATPGETATQMFKCWGQNKVRYHS